jgi:ankyrin repeat protein
MSAVCKTPLMVASGAARTAIARMLLDAGADVNRMNRIGETALTYAVVCGSVSEP